MKGRRFGGKIQALAQCITYNNVRKSENLKIRRKLKDLLITSFPQELIAKEVH